MTDKIKLAEQVLELMAKCRKDEANDYAHALEYIARAATLGEQLATQVLDDGLSNKNAAIIEALSYHGFERDDLTLDECVEIIRRNYKKVRQRSDRAMVLQIAELLAEANDQGV